ncbi:MAG: LysR family transcriptional regulator [Pirellulales bacterium]
MDWLNYHHLLNFWMVAREGSVQQASEVLHVSPASVSVQVKQLERSLGAKLLQKQGRGVALTELGQEVAAYAGDIFAKGQELVEMVQGRPLGRPLEFRVGVRDIMPKLVAFRLLQPALDLDQAVRLNYREGDMDQLVSELSIHKLDVVLSDIPLDPRYKIQAYSHRLGESGVTFVAVSQLAKKYRPKFPHSLGEAPILLLTPDSFMRRQLDRWFSDIGLVPQIVGEFSDSAMMKIAGSSGLGVLAVPSVIEADVKRIYGLHRVGVPDGVEEQFYAISVERKIRHPGVLAIRVHSP